MCALCYIQIDVRFMLYTGRYDLCNTQIDV